MRVLLLTGPSGSGKSSLARRIAENDGWVHVSEDDLWPEIGHGPGQLTTDEEQRLVHDLAERRVEAALAAGRRVVLEFLVYDPRRRWLEEYRSFLESRGVPFATRALRPALEEILERQRARGRSIEKDHERQRRHAGHQLRCLEAVPEAWVVDSAGETLEETYAAHFAALLGAKEADPRVGLQRTARGRSPRRFA